MSSPANDFIARSRKAIADPVLQAAMAKARPGFVLKRHNAIAQVSNFEALRIKAQEVRQRSLKDLDVYLAIFENRVTAAGGRVHWAATTEDLRKIVVAIAKTADAKTATKGKSMIAEEADLNNALEQAGIIPRETDLGEYILQLAKEPPSHIVAPALHKTRKQVTDLFQASHPLGSRPLESVKDIVDEARQMIRQHYLDADIGITGANILIADTGTAVLCTNEGNGDLTASLPKTHIITTSIDKVVPSWEDASAILRVLARSATGQSITTYTSFYSPRRSRDLDGAEQFHVVLLDNGRSTLLASEFEEMLQCIKCGACLNHCPVYQAVGGHSYHSVYPGPMGAVLTPLLRGNSEDVELANASTFCGRCEDVCPVKIPLPKLLRKLRHKSIAKGNKNLAYWLIKGFITLARHPRAYRRTTSTITAVVKTVFSKKGNLRKLPGLGAWLRKKDLAAPQGKSFQQQWRQQRGKNHGR
jgi:L-lactate dehydrogenase complex protein LldF